MFLCLYRVGAQVGPGPGGAGWMAGSISGQFLLRWQFPLLSPGPQVRGERPRPAAVGRVCHREGRKQENGAPPQQRPRRGELLSLLVWHPPFGPVWEATPDSPEQRGGFPKEGEGPSFGDSFVSFSSLRKRPCGASPGRQACAAGRWKKSGPLRQFWTRRSVSPCLLEWFWIR